MIKMVSEFSPKITNISPAVESRQTALVYSDRLKAVLSIPGLGFVWSCP